MKSRPVVYIRIARNTVVIALSLAAPLGILSVYLLPKFMPMRVKSVHVNKMVSIGTGDRSTSGGILATAGLTKSPNFYVNAPDRKSSIMLSAGYQGFADIAITQVQTNWPIRLGTVTLDLRPALKLSDPITGHKVWTLSVDASGLPVIERPPHE